MVALQIAQREELDLVLLDIDMPILDGLAMCRALRSDARTAAIPVIFLTGRDDRDGHVAALAAGGDDFIAKPLEPAILLARVANRVKLHRAERELKVMHEALQKYVPLPLRAGRQSGVVETVEATVLFSDLRGFTAMTEAQDPHAIFQAVSDVLAQQSEAVHAAGGYVDKFSGDGMLAIFEGEDAARRACEAAIAIVRWARTFAGIAFWNPPPIGLGIHHGEFMRGDLGGKQQRDWTVIGTTVNTAARLCGVAGPLEVIVSDAVRERVEGRMAFGAPRFTSLKGLRDAARIQALLIEA